MLWIAILVPYRWASKLTRTTHANFSRRWLCWTSQDWCFMFGAATFWSHIWLPSIRLCGAVWKALLLIGKSYRTCLCQIQCFSLDVLLSITLLTAGSSGPSIPGVALHTAGSSPFEFFTVPCALIIITIETDITCIWLKKEAWLICCSSNLKCY